MEVMIMKNLGHVKVLNRWEFEKVGLDYATTIDGFYIKWNEETQTGAYEYKGDLQLIHNWDELDEMMQLFPIY